MAHESGGPVCWTKAGAEALEDEDSNNSAGGAARLRAARGTWTRDGAKAPRLRMVLSTHVDDLKGTARRKVAESLLS